MSTGPSNYIASFDRHLEQHQEIDRKQQQQERQAITAERRTQQQEVPLQSRSPEQQMQDAPAATQKQRTYLNVPYPERRQAKALGAKWDGMAKCWYAPANVDIAPLQKWLTEPDNKRSTAEQLSTGSNQHQQQEVPVKPAQEKTYLAVSCEDKENAKALGAKWDGAAKSWYAPEGVDLAPLQKWIPQDRAISASVNSDPVQEFALALAAAGLIVKDIQADGELHRVPVEGRPHGRDGAYKLHLDGLKPAGFIQNFVTGYKENWKHDSGQRLSPEEVAQQRAQLAAQKAEREREREVLQWFAQK